MELLILAVIGVAGFAVYRSRLVAAAALAPTPQAAPVDSGSELPVDLDFGFLGPLVGEYIIEPAVEVFRAGIEAEEIRGTWEEKVQEVLNRGLCDDVILAGADRAAVMVKIISILGVPPGQWKGTPGMTFGTRVSIDNRIALVGRQPLPEDVPYIPSKDAVAVTGSGVAVLGADAVDFREPTPAAVVEAPGPTPEETQAQKLLAAARVLKDVLDFPDFGWSW